MFEKEINALVAEMIWLLKKVIFPGTVICLISFSMSHAGFMENINQVELMFAALFLVAAVNRARKGKK